MELQRLFPATGHGGWICVLELQVFDNTGVGGVRLRKWKDNKSSIPSHQVGERHADPTLFFVNEIAFITPFLSGRGRVPLPRRLQELADAKRQAQPHRGR